MKENKKTYLYMIVLFIVCPFIGNAQTTVNNITAGELHLQLSNTSSITDLTVTGHMNENDFFFIRENCPNLLTLDISGTDVTSVPEDALSRTANTEADFSLTANNTAPRYTTVNGTQVIFIDKRAAVSAASIVIDKSNGAKVSPDPASVTFTDGIPITFTVTSEDGSLTKQYTYMVTLDDWFTMIVNGDPEVEMTRNGVANTVADITKYFTNMAALANNYTDRFSFSANSLIKPKVEIVFSLGDMDKDRAGDHSTIESIFNLITNAGIPFITLYGNHDWEPESWGDGSYGFNPTGHNHNKYTLETVKKYVTASQGMTNGINSVNYFESGTTYTQPIPFAFKFRNVQFMVGNLYWFTCPYKAGGLLTNPVFEAPDVLVANVDAYISANSLNTVPTIWMQHYPLYAGSDIARWWTNQDANYDTGTSDPVPTSATAPYSYNLSTSYKLYSEKLDKYKSMIRSTKNPVHFSGHYHRAVTTDFPTGMPAFKDYTCPYCATGGAYLVLVRESVGVVEVKEVSFNY